MRPNLDLCDFHFSFILYNLIAKWKRADCTERQTVFCHRNQYEYFVFFGSRQMPLEFNSIDVCFFLLTY